MFKVILNCGRTPSFQRVFPSSSNRFMTAGIRMFSAEASVESKITSILQKEFKPTLVEVKDVSGGCGAMFNIIVESEKFKGVSLVNQHKMVTRALSEEIKDMHGLTVKTSVPK